MVWHPSRNGGKTGVARLDRQYVPDIVTVRFLLVKMIWFEMEQVDVVLLSL